MNTTKARKGRTQKEIVRHGLVSELEPGAFTVLYIMNSCTNSRGECSLSLHEIADNIGVNVALTKRYINQLLDFEWDNKQLITKTHEDKGWMRFSTYKVHPYVKSFL